jgi:hypothetical protein
MEIAEFVAQGYLQEVNRQFFHPLGLSLGVYGRKTDDPGHGAVDPGPTAWIDIAETDDPDGYAFGGETALTAEDVARAQRIDVRRQDLAAHRRRNYGYDVQPLVVDKSVNDARR